MENCGKDGEVIEWEEGVDIENEITPLNAPMFLSQELSLVLRIKEDT